MHVRMSLLATAVLLAGPAAAQVAGRWVASLPSEEGPLPLVYDLHVDAAGRLEGAVLSAQIGSVKIDKGRSAGNTLAFTVAWKAPDGRPLSIDYTGVVNGDTLELTAKWVEGPEAPAEFNVVAKRGP